MEWVNSVNIRINLVKFCDCHFSRANTVDKTCYPEQINILIRHWLQSILSDEYHQSVKYSSRLNAFGELKAHNKVTALGLPICIEEASAKAVE